MNEENNLNQVNSKKDTINSNTYNIINCLIKFYSI